MTAKQREWLVRRVDQALQMTEKEKMTDSDWQWLHGFIKQTVAQSKNNPVVLHVMCAVISGKEKEDKQ